MFAILTIIQTTQLTDFIIMKKHKKIKENASRVNKKLCPYIREMAINGCIKEKPDDRFYECLKDLRYIRVGLKNIANVAHFTKRINAVQYDKEIEKIDKFILEIKTEYL